MLVMNNFIFKLRKPFIIMIKNMKHLGINLTTDVQDLYFKTAKRN